LPFIASAHAIVRRYVMELPARRIPTSVSFMVAPVLSGGNSCSPRSVGVELGPSGPCRARSSAWAWPSSNPFEQGQATGWNGWLEGREHE
jgi:hypothetical protein